MATVAQRHHPLWSSWGVSEQQTSERIRVLLARTYFGSCATLYDAGKRCIEVTGGPPELDTLLFLRRPVPVTVKHIRFTGRLHVSDEFVPCKLTDCEMFFGLFSSSLHGGHDCLLLGMFARVYAVGYREGLYPLAGVYNIRGRFGTFQFVDYGGISPRRCYPEVAREVIGDPSDGTGVM